jgi:hypothetical protein
MPFYKEDLHHLATSCKGFELDCNEVMQKITPCVSYLLLFLRQSGSPL